MADLHLEKLLDYSHINGQITIIHIILECMHKDSRVKVYYNNIL